MQWRKVVVCGRTAHRSITTQAHSTQAHNNTSTQRWGDLAAGSLYFPLILSKFYTNFYNKDVDNRSFTSFPFSSPQFKCMKTSVYCIAKGWPSEDFTEWRVHSLSSTSSPKGTSVSRAVFPSVSHRWSKFGFCEAVSYFTLIPSSQENSFLNL